MLLTVSTEKLLHNALKEDGNINNETIKVPSYPACRRQAEGLVNKLNLLEMILPLWITGSQDPIIAKFFNKKKTIESRKFM